jgi:hypothetical protein
METRLQASRRLLGLYSVWDPSRHRQAFVGGHKQTIWGAGREVGVALIAVGFCDSTIYTFNFVNKGSVIMTS